MIWITPELKVPVNSRQVAEHLGIHPTTYKQRLRLRGKDATLTYFPGRIPPSMFRNPRDAIKASLAKQKEIVLKPLAIEDVPTTGAVSLIADIIGDAVDELRRKKCKEAAAFLVNKNGMLEFYLEVYPGIKTKQYMNLLSALVEQHLPKTKL